MHCVSVKPNSRISAHAWDRKCAPPIELETASGQLQLATANRSFAAETLREARDRFNLGVGTTVEVVQAEEQVAGAEADYIGSLFSLDVARLSLSRSSGQAESSLPDLLEGKRP